MPERSFWSWTLVIEADGRRHTLPGASDAPLDATRDTILPMILRDIPARFRDRRGRFQLIDFTATRTG